MEDKDYENSYAIPANYTDSGKILGGMLSLRNVIEAVVLLTGLGFIELKFIPMQDPIRIIVMVVTLLPLGLVALTGIDGDSLLQYLGHIGKFLRRRRQLHFNRIGGRNGKKDKK